MTFVNPKEYNTWLIENKQNITIIDYVKQINKILYNIDINFLDEFIELVSKNECCIHHEMLEKYGIINFKSGGSKDVKKLLLQYNLEEIKDFRVGNVSVSAPKGGCTHKTEYYLHPRAFKMCLMRSKNTKIYAKYYLLLEECIKYFNDYQLELQKKYIIEYKTKIDKQELELKGKDDKIDELIKINKENRKHIQELLKYSKDTQDKLDDVMLDLKIKDEDNFEVTEKLDRTITSLNVIKNKLNIAVEDRVVKPSNKELTEYFLIMKNLDVIQIQIMFIMS